MNFQHQRIYLGVSSSSASVIEQWQQAIDWDKAGGLLPAIIQDLCTRQVLMQGFMNLEALQQSLNSAKVTFYSRSKQRLWCKGETSNNFLTIRELALDCDCDSLLILVEPSGPTCHRGSNSCYSTPFIKTLNTPKHNTISELTRLGGNFASGESLGLGWLGALERIVQQRLSTNTEESYVQSLWQSGLQRIAQKVGEEGVEVALAAIVLQTSTEPNDSLLKKELASEAGDLLFHLIVLLQACGLNLQDVIAVLEQRHHKSLEAVNNSNKKD